MKIGATATHVKGGCLVGMQASKGGRKLSENCVADWILMLITNLALELLLYELCFPTTPPFFLFLFLFFNYLFNNK